MGEYVWYRYKIQFFLIIHTFDNLQIETRQTKSASQYIHNTRLTSIDNKKPKINHSNILQGKLAQCLNSSQNTTMESCDPKLLLYLHDLIHILASHLFLNAHTYNTIIKFYLVQHVCFRTLKIFQKSWLFDNVYIISHSTNFSSYILFFIYI